MYYLCKYNSLINSSTCALYKQNNVFFYFGLLLYLFGFNCHRFGAFKKKNMFANANSVYRTHQLHAWFLYP